MQRKIIFMAIGSFLVGGGTGFLVGRQVWKKIFNKRLEEERASLEEVRKEMLRTIEKKKEEKEKVSFSVDYDPLIARYEKHVIDNNYVSTNPKEEDVDEIRAISMYQYASDVNYEKQTLTYYDEDDMLTDENGEEIEPDSVIMKNFYSYFGEDMFGDEDTIYVRNDKLGTDFEVIRSYLHVGDHPGFDDED